jgi:hypothetical protein
VYRVFVVCVSCDVCVSRVSYIVCVSVSCVYRFSCVCVSCAACICVCRVYGMCVV